MFSSLIFLYEGFGWFFFFFFVSRKVLAKALPESPVKFSKGCLECSASSYKNFSVCCVSNDRIVKKVYSV